MYKSTADIFFTLWSEAKQVESFLLNFKGEMGLYEMRKFPDQETYIRIDTKVTNKKIIILADMYQPDSKMLPLLFFLKTLKALGSHSISLFLPYLPYMRQDKQFHSGECVSSIIFADYISGVCDHLITIDPHLHRYHSLSEIYSIKTTVLSATNAIADYIKKHIQQPLIVGPDQESQQWVETIAKKINCPFVTLSKMRLGDRKVNIHVPDVRSYQDFQPVIVDDIFSSGHTLCQTIMELKKSLKKSPVCIGIHGLFAEGAYEKILAAGAYKIVTCNTVSHISNEINVLSLI